MKTIQIDDDLYHHIASKTQHIGESASDILRRLVWPESVRDAHQGEEQDTQGSQQISQQEHQNENQGAQAICDAQSVIQELQKQDLSSIAKMVDRWLVALSIIHKYNSSQFTKVLGISGRNRTYFAQDKETLLATGSSTNPKNVPNSNFWVITNNNTVKKITMLKNVASTVGFSDSEVQKLLNVFAPELIDD